MKLVRSYWNNLSKQFVLLLKIKAFQNKQISVETVARVNQVKRQILSIETMKEQFLFLLDSQSVKDQCV